MWHYLYDLATGRLLTEDDGTTLPSPLPLGIGDYVLAERRTEAHRWDEATRTFVPLAPLPVFDKLDDLLDDTNLPPLTAAQRQKLRDVVEKHWPREERLRH